MVSASPPAAIISEFPGAAQRRPRFLVRSTMVIIGLRIRTATTTWRTIDSPRLAFFAGLVVILFFRAPSSSRRSCSRAKWSPLPDLEGRDDRPGPGGAQPRRTSSLAQRGTETSDRIEKGRIVRQEPAPALENPQHHGRPDRDQRGQRHGHCPRFASKSLDEVLTLLQAAGLTRGRLTQVHTPASPRAASWPRRPNRARSWSGASPSASSSARAASKTATSCPTSSAGGPTSVIGLPRQPRFQVADVRYVYYPGAPAGLIVQQDPPNGFRVQKRNRISLEVSR